MVEVIEWVDMDLGIAGLASAVVVCDCCSVVDRDTLKLLNPFVLLKQLINKKIYLFGNNGKVSVISDFLRIRNDVTTV